MFALLMLACNRTKHNSATDHAYSMLERVAELNAGGDKQGALALADSALRMHPADTTRCWLLSEKAVTLVDMGRMADAVDVAQGAYRLAEKLPQFGITECLIQYKCSENTPPPYAIRSG